MSVTFTITATEKISDWKDLNDEFSQPMTGRSMALAIVSEGALDATVVALQLYWSDDNGTTVYKARTQSGFAKATISQDPTGDGDEGEIILLPPTVFPHVTKLSGKWAIAMVTGADVKVAAGANRTFILDAVEV
jgi:hypothetical protein